MTEKFPSLAKEFSVYVLFFFVSLIYVWTLISVFGKEFNQLFKGNELMYIFFIFFILLLISSLLIMFYNMEKYHKINTNYVVAQLSFAGMLFITSFMFIAFSNFVQFLLNALLLTSITIFLFSIPPIIYIIFRKLEPNPLKSCFNRTKSGLSELLKDSQEPLFHKNIVDIFYIVSNYSDGIKEIKNSFGEVIHLNDINIIKSDTKKSITEILDELTISIPYYIFHGEIEQMKEMETHIENINKCLGDIYSIAGGQFVVEILRMNGKINQYFKENFFDFSKNEDRHIRKYGNEFYERKIFLVLLSLVSSIILSKLGPTF